jgi:hypothetical protein
VKRDGGESGPPECSVVTWFSGRPNEGGFATHIRQSQGRPGLVLAFTVTPGQVLAYYLLKRLLPIIELR